MGLHNTDTFYYLLDNSIKMLQMAPMIGKYVCIKEHVLENLKFLL